MIDDMFARLDGEDGRRESLAEGALVLRGFALAEAPAVLAALAGICAAAPFRHLCTPGGLRMSVAMSNCGPLGWVSDAQGYRYTPQDPLSGLPWPAMPALFADLAGRAAAAAGFPAFVPDACLINRYAPGSKMSLHQDKDEADLAAPIVSLSLGLPATFLFGGWQRSDACQRLLLTHGDVLVWGGPARLRYHGVLPVKPGRHDEVGEYRVNLTFRKARA